MVARKPENQRTYIVKVQTPLSPPGAEALIYDRDKAHLQMRKLDAAEDQQMHGEPKRFFKAWWSDATGWVLISRAQWQRW